MKQNLESVSILMVEDNQVDIDLALLAFSRVKFSKPIQVARDGAEALEMIKNWHQDSPLPQLILMDIKLPKISGLEALKEIKNSYETKHIPVVMLTSSNNDEDINTAYAYGANSYIIKPIDFDKFVFLITTLCDYWISMNIKPEDWR